MVVAYRSASRARAPHVATRPSAGLAVPHQHARDRGYCAVSARRSGDPSPSHERGSRAHDTRLDTRLVVHA